MSSLSQASTPHSISGVDMLFLAFVRFLNLILLAIMAIVCGIVDTVLEHRYYPSGALWLYNDNRSGDNPAINGLVTLVFALITYVYDTLAIHGTVQFICVHRFQNIVPISLYISIEFVRTCQAAFIYFDREMVYEKTGQPTLARSWNLSDDLGQIEYIFSDKTGTLTQVHPPLCLFLSFKHSVDDIGILFRIRWCSENVPSAGKYIMVTIRRDP